MTTILAQAAEQAVGSAMGVGAAIVLLLIQAAIGSLVGALFVQLATKWVCGFMPSYGMAFKATFVVAIVEFAVGAIMAAIGMSETTMRMAIAGAIAFLVGAAIYGQMITGPGGPIGMGKGALVSLVRILIGIAVAMVILFVASLVWAGSAA